MQKSHSAGQQYPNNVFARTRVQNAFRVFGMLVVICLNITSIGSFCDRLTHHLPINPIFELVSLIVVLFFDVTILLPIVFEVDSATAEPDRLILKTTLFKKSIPWSNIVELRSPVYMRIAILRTKRCFYLINKRQISRYDELSAIVTDKLKLLQTNG